jgi:hypothetical protein
MQLEKAIHNHLRFADDFKYVVISGLPKTGTTLPLTLLDGHPELTVFPEELRFMDSGCQVMENDNAVDKFLNNANTRMMEIQSAEFTELREHVGTGYGKRDYSNIDFDIFRDGVGFTFRYAETPIQRYFGVFLSYEIASGGNFDTLASRGILVSKSPRNELYLFSWGRMLKGKGLYIWTVRDPVELYLSYLNISSELGKELPDPDSFSELINSRDRLLTISRLGTEQLRIQKYEELIANPETQMTEIAEFLSVNYQPCMMNPTKNSVSWAGNSSRGIRKEAIYKNPIKARSVLDRRVVSKIEEMTEGFMKRHEYPRSAFSELEIGGVDSSTLVLEDDAS